MDEFSSPKGRLPEDSQEFFFGFEGIIYENFFFF